MQRPYFCASVFLFWGSIGAATEARSVARRAKRAKRLMAFKVARARAKREAVKQPRGKPNLNFKFNSKGF